MAAVTVARAPNCLDIIFEVYDSYIRNKWDHKLCNRGSYGSKNLGVSNYSSKHCRGSFRLSFVTGASSGPQLLGCFYQLGSLLGVLIATALLFRVYISAPDFWKLPCLPIGTCKLKMAHARTA